MTGYEYIRLEIDMGDLSELNSLSADGWRVVAVIEDSGLEGGAAHFVLLERPLPQAVRRRNT
jgi:hypothetical protein